MQIAAICVLVSLTNHGWSATVWIGIGITNSKSFKVYHEVSTSGIRVNDLFCESRNVVPAVGLGGDVQRIRLVL